VWEEAHILQFLFFVGLVWRELTSSMNPIVHAAFYLMKKIAWLTFWILARDNLSSTME
jgi:hypothetical protein